MTMRMETPSTAAAIEDLHLDVLSQILRRLDGRDLAAASAASPAIRAAATETWRHLCLSTWPSLRNHNLLLPFLSCSFFSDAFGFPLITGPIDLSAAAATPEIILSAIDLYVDGRAVASKIVATETGSPWFASTPFRVDLDALELNELPSGGELSLSWLAIDPTCGKVVNVSSRRPVAVEKSWCDDGTRARFAVALGDTAAAVVVATCEGRRVCQVSLTVEGGEEGACLGGKDAVAVLTEAMGGGRRCWKGAADEVEKMYGRYEKRKLEKARKEARAEWRCAVVGAAAFLTFLALAAFS